MLKTLENDQVFVGIDVHSKTYHVTIVAAKTVIHRQSMAAADTNQDMLRRIETRFACNVLTEVDVRRCKSQRLANRLYLHFDTEFTWPALDLPVLGDHGRCYGLTQHFGILVNGIVVPCCLDKEGAIPLGDLNETPLNEILASTRAKAIVRGFAQGKLVEDLCQRCQYITRFSARG